MSYDKRKLERASLAIIVMGLLTLVGCAATNRRASTEGSVQPNAVMMMQSYFDTVTRLGSSPPNQQTDLYYEIERDYTKAPTTTNSLRFALALLTPGHTNANATQGKRVLESLLTTPERLIPLERSLATMMLQDASARVALEAENRRLAATLDESNRAQAHSDKRAQAQADDNARLRKALAEAQQKLDAITTIERSIIERRSTPPGSSRESAAETQSPSAGR